MSAPKTPQTFCALSVAALFLASPSLSLASPGSATSSRAVARADTESTAPSRRRRVEKKASKSKPHKRSEKAKQHKRKRGRVKHHRGFTGWSVPRSELRTESLPRPSGDVWVYAENLREEVRVNIYDEDGNINDAALALLDGGFRCKRTQDVRAVDPRLYEILSIIFDRFDGQRIDLISGFRHQLNEGSRHFHAAAMDIRVPGVGLEKLFDFAQSLDRGGMGIGIYPHSGFVHVDIRAPGDPSYRWRDYSGPKKNKRKKPRSKRPST